MILIVSQFILSLFLLYAGAELVVNSSILLSNRFRVPRLIIGLTIVSLATSLPEFFVCLQAALIGLHEFAIGNVIGSNISNLTLVLGLTAVICPIILRKEEITLQYLPLICVTIFFIISFLFFNAFSLGYAFLAIMLLSIFNIILFKYGKRIIQSEDYHLANNDITIMGFKIVIKSLFLIMIFLISGAILLWKGSDLLVSSSSSIASFFNLSDRVISLTLVALGTSLPELIACVYSAFKNETKLAFGNLIGSNIFNILAVLGLTSLVTPIELNMSLTYDVVVMLSVTILLIPILYFGKNIITRLFGVVLLLMYLIYIMSIF